VGEAGCRKVPQEHVGSERGLSAKFFGYVSDGHVEGIHGLVPEQGQLCFIGGDDDGDDSPALPNVGVE
jgi:hypothetical protein